VLDGDAVVAVGPRSSASIACPDNPDAAPPLPRSRSLSPLVQRGAVRWAWPRAP